MPLKESRQVFFHIKSFFEYNCSFKIDNMSNFYLQIVFNFPFLQKLDKFCCMTCKIRLEFSSYITTHTKEQHHDSTNPLR